MKELSVSLLLLFLVGYSLQDFVYSDFELTTGLIFNGDATTSSCVELDEHKYQADHGKNDPSTDEADSEVFEIMEPDVVYTRRTSTNTDTSDEVSKKYAVIGHLDSFQSAPTTACPTRVRLTASKAKQLGTLFHHTPVSVLTGFETTFVFQITDQSRACNVVRDRHFTLQQHKSCFVHGGDGFAFVLHGDSEGPFAKGSAGGGLGFEGISNSLAIKFDTTYNPDKGDLFSDHIGIHSASIESNGPNTSTLLGVPVPHAVADGNEHTVKVVYLPYVETSWLSTFTATPSLIPFLKDNGENHRLGTFGVFIDDMTEPLTAFPLNLSVLLDLKEYVANVGFTAATGERFQKHDILKWVFCEQPGCPKTELDPSVWPLNFDYHQGSEVNP